jgi:signal transduction histidine kinase
VEAQEELERIAHLTKQTLGFYRSESVVAPMRLSSILRSLTAMLSPKISNRRVRLGIEGDGDPEVFVAAGEIRQLFSNLLSNSLDAVGQGGRIRVRVSEGREWGHSGAPGMRVTIADSGCGIPRKTAPGFLNRSSLPKKKLAPDWACGCASASWRSTGARYNFAAAPDQAGVERWCQCFCRC